MKPRPEGFLSSEKIDQAGEAFSYIEELHGYLWKFVRHFKPWANGNLSDHLDDAIAAAKYYDKP